MTWCEVAKWAALTCAVLLVFSPNSRCGGASQRAASKRLLARSCRIGIASMGGRPRSERERPRNPNLRTIVLPRGLLQILSRATRAATSSCVHGYISHPEIRILRSCFGSWGPRYTSQRKPGSLKERFSLCKMVSSRMWWGMAFWRHTASAHPKLQNKPNPIR